MAIKQKKNGNGGVNTRDQFGTRLKRTFRTKSELKYLKAQSSCRSMKIS